MQDVTDSNKENCDAGLGFISAYQIYKREFHSLYLWLCFQGPVRSWFKIVWRTKVNTLCIIKSKGVHIETILKIAYFRSWKIRNSASSISWSTVFKAHRYWMTTNASMKHLVTSVWWRYIKNLYSYWERGIIGRVCNMANACMDTIPLMFKCEWE